MASFPQESVDPFLLNFLGPLGAKKIRRCKLQKQVSQRRWV
jgi:hypothetical protein